MIKIKVAGESAGAILVGLFSQHDLIHQPATQRRRSRKPRRRHAAQTLLQRLEQRHEIPDRKHVPFHKRAQGRHAAQVLIDRVGK